MYSDMSDFEINNYVAFALGYVVKTEFEEGLAGFTREYHEQYPDTIWAAPTDDRGEQCEAWEQMNFCAIPEQAWPIITENKIAVMPDSDGTWKAGVLPKSKNGEHVIGWANFTMSEARPLRAAMIAFLKMQQPK